MGGKAGSVNQPVTAFGLWSLAFDGLGFAFQELPSKTKGQSPKYISLHCFINDCCQRIILQNLVALELTV